MKLAFSMSLAGLSIFIGLVCSFKQTSAACCNYTITGYTPTCAVISGYPRSYTTSHSSCAASVIAPACQSSCIGSPSGNCKISAISTVADSFCPF